MPRSHDPEARATTIRPIAIVGAVAGVLLFAYTLRAAGLWAVIEGARAVGAGFVLVLFLSGLRHFIRSAAWTNCVEPSERLGLRDAFVAFVTGDAIGNLTPFGPVASEGTKAVLVRPQLRSLGAVSSIALENLFYGVSVAVMVIVGALAFMYGFQAGSEIRAASLVIVASALVAGVMAWWLLTRQPRLLSGLGSWFVERMPGSPHESKLESIRALEDRIHGFVGRNPGRVGRILLLEFLFHAAGVAEAYLLVILLIGTSPQAFLQAVVLETVNRVLTVVFKFVPLRVGVDEAGSGLLTAALGLGTAPGVTMAIIRKARTLIWAAVGVAFLVRRGFSVGSVVRQASGTLEGNSSVDGR